MQRFQSSHQQCWYSGGAFYTNKMSESVCALCHQNYPSFICFCAELLLCNQCLSPHLLANPTSAHKPVPLSSPEQPSQTCLVSPHSHRAREVLVKEIARLQAFLPHALQQLQSMRRNWEEQIIKVTDDYARVISDEVNKLVTQAELCLQQLDDPKTHEENPLLSRLLSLGQDEELFTLSLAMRQVNIAGLFKQVINYRVTCEGQRHDQRLLYKFFGGTNVVSVFDPQIESNTFLLPTNAKFLHNSCWVVTDAGSVLITGGSSTGKSRNDVYLFQPAQCGIMSVEPMQVARRSHTSVCFGLSCFVFGGILEEEPLSLCEVYSLRDRQWAGLPHMSERRAYLGSCQCEQKIYICGGGDTASMEVFSPDTVTFQLVPLDMEVLDSVSMLAIESAVFIFHGNFQGYVSRLDLLTSRICKLNALCYGNSWSSCAPVRLQDSVYFLRADSVFKYDLKTGASAYVLRMSKSLKKAEED